jgi:hypothetical protein
MGLLRAGRVWVSRKVWSVYITLIDGSEGERGAGLVPAPCVGDVVGGDVAGVDSLRRSRVSLVMRLLLGDVMSAVDCLVSGLYQL